MVTRTPQELLLLRAAALAAPDQFVIEHLLGVVPYVFGTRDSFGEFCEEVAAKLDVPVDSITLVGSGRLGFSLNKARLLSTFSDESDLDVAIISSPLFDAAWEELLTNADSFALTGDEERRRFTKTRKKLFFGYLRPDYLPLTLSLSRSWFPRLAGPYSSPVAGRHEVNAWLFKSSTHMRLFYSSYLATIQTSIRTLLQARGELQ